MSCVCTHLRGKEADTLAYFCRNIMGHAGRVDDPLTLRFGQHPQCLGIAGVTV